jgi:hypothetical protein
MGGDGVVGTGLRSEVAFRLADWHAGFDRSTLTYRCQRLPASSAADRIVEGVTAGVRADGVVVGQGPSRARVRVLADAVATRTR